MSDWCRVPSTVSNVYATGWCAHAARGVILDSQMQAFNVADELIKDWKDGKFIKKDPIKEVSSNARNSSPIKSLLDQRRVSYITWEDWLYADECERRMGALLGKPREKIYDLKSLLRIWKN